MCYVRALLRIRKCQKLAKIGIVEIAEENFISFERLDAFQ